MNLMDSLEEVKVLLDKLKDIESQSFDEDLMRIYHLFSKMEREIILEKRYKERSNDS